MCRQLICVFSFILLLGLASGASAELVGHWTFDDGSGTTATDSSGNGNDGTVNGGANWVIGKDLGALEFDGIDDYVSIGEILLSNVSEFSLVGWVNAGNPGGSRIGLFGQNDVIEMGLNAGNVSIWTSAAATTQTTWPFPNNTWHHVAVVANTTSMRIYLDGQLAVTGSGAANYGSSSYDFNIGGGGIWDASGNWFSGQLDDVRVYDHALSQAEVEETMVAKGWPYAFDPIPDDGAVYTAGYVSMQWTPGVSAVSHDVYLGENLDDVNNGTGGTFRGNQTNAYLLAGLGLAGDPYPDGLVPGTTYYWRIDEVNDLDPDSPWRGEVWSFSIPSNKAYEPVPADGARFVDTNPTLSWTEGLNAALHFVYFGDNAADVAAGTGGTDKGQVPITSFSPGTLESDKTYYWRVDTFDDSAALHTGDVWSFRTMPEMTITDPNLIGWWKLDEGEGTAALDWSGHGNHGTLMGDPQWVAGYDGEALELDGTGDYVTIPSIGVNSNTVTMTAWVKRDGDQPGWAGIVFHRTGTACGIGFSGQGGMTNHLQYHWNDNDAATYNFASGLVVPDNEWAFVAVVVEPTKATLYLNGTANFAVNPIAHITQALSGPLLFGVDTNNMNRIVQGVIDDARVYDKALTPAELEAVMRGDPLLAWDPSPANGSTPSIDEAVPLSWSPGEQVAQHDVYFGTDRDAVEDADTSTAGIYRSRQGATSYTPPEGVEWGGGPYYWRINEYNTDGTISKGRIWSFQVADHLIVDNFENYGGDEVPVEEQIWYGWRDGLGYGAIGAPPYYAGNGTGAEVGDLGTLSYTEETITHDGSDQSMPYWYNNNKPDKFKYSEAKMTLTAPRDWTQEQVKALSLWFRGYPASTGSFVEAPAGTYTVNGSGADIWNIGPGEGEYGDEFHFAYRQLTGAGTIIARVDSVEDTHDWAKAGVMIRETLEPGSKHAFACVTPASGVSSQGRPDVGAASFSTTQAGITAPHWVKLERDLSGNFTVSHSTNGSTWEPVTGATPENIQMNTTVYIGLAVTSHDVALTCEAVFSNVQISGNVTGQWMHQDIGITSNAAERMYVAVANRTDALAVVYHDDPDAATQIDTWTEWPIDLKEFQDKGINLADVNSIAIGFGDRNNPQAGGAGKMYFDDIRLYRARFIPELVTLSEADLNRNGVVDFGDIEVMGADWLNQGGDGLWYEYGEGSWNLLPDFGIVATAKQGVINNFDIAVRNQNDNFCFRFSGKINIAAAGDYTFYTTSDDGSQLFIDGAMLVDNDSTHGMVEQSGVVTLTAGLHDIVVTMFEAGGGESLLVEYEGPGVARQEIPGDVLSLPAPVSDLNQDGAVDFQDYAVLVDEWGRETLWPEW